MPFDSGDMDDFWNIEMLIPKKKKKLSPFATREATASCNVGEPAPAESTRTKLTCLGGSREASSESYAPEGYGLIRRVVISRLLDRYDFYDTFRRAAELYFDRRGERCDFAPFYSYMPQYSQLSTEQRDYYFYFRERVRCGEYIKSDYSYVYLYVYEILNLPERVTPERGLALLISIWREYRKALPLLDGTLPLWIQDYCLVHRLACPAALFSDSLSAAIAVSPLTEFYFSAEGLDSRATLDAIIARLSDYDPRGGRFMTQENRATIETHLRGAMRAVLRRLEKDGALATEESIRIVKRDAFARSLCTHKVKCKLEIEYVSLSAADRLRADVTAAVRYTENKLRALLGVKSRLGVKGLPDTIKREIDEYFARQMMPGGSFAPKVNIPEYEKLYSAPSERLSLRGADEIERASWSTTMRLVEYDDDRPAEAVTEIPKEPDAAEESALSAEDVAILSSAYRYTYEGGAGVSDDTAAERINEHFADLIGDVVLEFDGEYYKIIDDYKEDIKEWIR